MDVMTAVRPVIKVLKDYEIPFNFGLSELREIQFLIPAMLEKACKDKEDFLKELTVNPNTALMGFLNALLLKDWDDKTNKPGETLSQFLRFLDRVFMTETPLEDLQVLDLLDKFDQLGQKVGSDVKKNSKSTQDTTQQNTQKKLSSTATGKKQKKKSTVKK